MLDELGIDRTGHGWDGWLRTEKAIPKAALRDERLVESVMLAAATALGGERPTPLPARCAGSCAAPATPTIGDVVHGSSRASATRRSPRADHRRVGARERLLDVAERHPDRLCIELDALATRVLLDERSRAVGVEYLKGAAPLPRPCERPAESPASAREVRAPARGDPVPAAPSTRRSC